jgi:tetratricopeptide (TPR) repeat protein
MACRFVAFCLGLLCLGCHALGPLASDSASETAAQLWEKGQEAMRRGQPEEAVEFYQRSLFIDPGLMRNYLSLAAAYMEQGDDEAACPHLSRYVNAHPEQVTLRVYLADLLLRLKRLPDARDEFERCVATAQQREEAAQAHLLHCHTRLMEIAEESEDIYREHLHRGIGLLLLARQRSTLPDPDGELSAEALLCKAAGELTLAHLEKPDEARPSWYLHEVWSGLAQRQPARRCLRAAEAAAPFSYLTASEQRDLQLACQWRQAERPIK